MTTVREATFELFRAHGMTTIFGNPGSTELPMLSDFPEDFSYVLGLQELAVVGMADGYAQATGRPTHVNLHTAPGVGNAVGGLYNAQANKSPLVVTAGQQVRPHVAIEANLTNRDAILGPQPYVKWAHEPVRAADVVRQVQEAIAGMDMLGFNCTLMPIRNTTETRETKLSMACPECAKDNVAMPMGQFYRGKSCTHTPTDGRPGFTVSDPVVKEALTPLLLDHRSRIFADCFRNPF